MKPKISPDFIRGILFSVVAYGCYSSLQALQVGTTFRDPIHSVVQISVCFVLLILHVGLCVALAIGSPSSRRAAFAYFVILAISQVAAMCYFRFALATTYASNSFGLSVFWPILSCVMAVVSYALYTDRFHESVARPCAT